MNTTLDDGGPAFPQKEPLTSDYPGMSLRDWFAGMAIAECFAAPCPPAWRQGSQEHREQSVAAAYAIADAMIAARKEAK